MFCIVVVGMVEIQSCGGLVNDSALCGIEEQVKVEVNDVNVNVIAAELEKEREKNQQLLERISLLEAQIQQRDYLLHHHNQSPLIDTQVWFLFTLCILSLCFNNFEVLFNSQYGYCCVLFIRRNVL